MDMKVIGVVLRYDFNDYEIMLADIDEKDGNKILNIITKYEDDCCGHRNTREMTLNDANISWIERKYVQKYKDTSTGEIITLPRIFDRYFSINGSCDGFEEYVKNGFRNGNEVEYIKL